MSVAAVAQIEQFVFSHAAPLMVAAGLNTTPDANGIYADIAGPFDRALRLFGVTPGVRYVPSDADVANVDTDDSLAFEARVLVETLLILRTRLATKVDQQQGQDKQMLSQRAGSLDALLTYWTPIGEAPTELAGSFGTVDLGFDGPGCTVDA